MKKFFNSIGQFLLAALDPFFVLLTRYMGRQGLILNVYTVPEGAICYVSQTFASAKTVSAITNANPAVATSTAHGYSNDDEFLFLSGWEDATNSVYRAGSVATNAFNVTGLVTTDTDFFAAGAGVGTAQKISSWIAIPQVLTISSSGGDPKYTTVQPLAKRNAIQIPTGFNPTSITMSLAHDSSNADFQTLQTISRSLTEVAFKLVMSGGAIVYGYGNFAVSEVPSLNLGQVNTVTASLSLLGRAVSYDT